MDYREGLRGVRGVLLWGLFFLTIAVLLSGRHARAGDSQFWGNYPPEVHEWFPTVMQPGFEEFHDSGHSCCGSGDAFEARVTGENIITRDITIVVDDGKGAIPDGTEVNVPRDKIQTKYGNPVGKLVVFLSIGQPSTVYCLVPAAGG